MVGRSRLGDFVRRAAHIAGRRFEEARTSYREGQTAAETSDLPRDEDGRARIVCRRHAERRAVDIDDRGRPECYESGHPDCEGCVSDVRKDRVETW